MYWKEIYFNKATREGERNRCRCKSGLFAAVALYCCSLSFCTNCNKCCVLSDTFLLSPCYAFYTSYLFSPSLCALSQLLFFTTPPPLLISLAPLIITRLLLSLRASISSCISTFLYIIHFSTTRSICLLYIQPFNLLAFSLFRFFLYLCTVSLAFFTKETILEACPFYHSHSVSSTNDCTCSQLSFTLLANPLCLCLQKHCFIKKKLTYANAMLTIYVNH